MKARTLFPRAVKVLLAFLAFSTFSLQAASNTFAFSGIDTNSIDPKSLVPTQAEKDARLGWWRDARFGMFVHWGVSAVLAGTYHGKVFRGYAEHIQRGLKIPQDAYRKDAVEQFNPKFFDADQWILAAKNTGMGYFIVTAKHHDGFAMYDSKVSDYNVVRATPFHRDPMRELREAARRHGIKFGFYYSHAFDWGEVNAPGNDWEWNNPGGDKLLGGSDWWLTTPAFIPKAHSYVSEKAIPQIEELIRNYDPDILWFDTPHKLPPWENLRILDAVRKLKPSLVVNGRLIRGLGDYLNTADRPSGLHPTQGDWEAIPTTNESYGYNANDHSHKPPSFFIRLLASAAARGGNILMNVGPRGDGLMDPTDIAILDGIGTWWKLNGESIRGTTATPLPIQPWGESTLKGNRLYLHVFSWPKDGNNLVIGGMNCEVTRAFLLADPSHQLEVRRDGPDLFVKVPAVAPDPADSVIVLESDHPPAGSQARLVLPGETAELKGFDGILHGNLAFQDGKRGRDFVNHWLTTKDFVTWKIRLKEAQNFEASIHYVGSSAQSRTISIEGDAGREKKAATKEDGGTYSLSVDRTTLRGNVSRGSRTDVLGKITIPKGTHEVKLQAESISGQELMQFHDVTLTPVRE